ncbi:MAG: hypothetical protein WBD80_00465 [Xanthobacteraceae bacterium]
MLTPLVGTAVQAKACGVPPPISNAATELDAINRRSLVPLAPLAPRIQRPWAGIQRFAESDHFVPVQGYLGGARRRNVLM